MKVGAMLVGAAALLVPSVAFAVEPVLGAVGEAGSGIEMGGGSGTFALQRARTQLRAGIELALDQKKIDSVRALVLAELEPYPSIGFDAEYCHHVSQNFFLQAGGVVLVAPQSMFGVTAGARFEIPLGTRARFDLGPQVAGFFFGTDVPEATVIFHVLFLAGVHVSF